MAKEINTPRKFGTEKRREILNKSKASDDEYLRKFKKTMKIDVASNQNEESRLSPLKLCTPTNKHEFGTEAKTSRRNTRTAKVLSVAKEDALGLPCNSYSFDEKFQLSD